MTRPADVSAVVCTMNSVNAIERCLVSLREAGVGQLIVVDASSTDGTLEVAMRIADLVLSDPGIGLGNARNLGIAETTGAFILNMGSDNVMPHRQLDRMIRDLQEGRLQGVSARTLIEGRSYHARSLNAWRTGRFRPGPALVIGTPTLFKGDLLRRHPFDPLCQHSDDSELCERWTRELGARFAISEAFVLEVGKTSWPELVARCRNYGTSDDEVFQRGRRSGWGLRRRVQSLLHPFKADFITPLRNLPIHQGVVAVPFLATVATLRYRFWARTALRRRKHRPKA